jgi:hypothetical protein
MTLVVAVVVDGVIAAAARRRSMIAGAECSVVLRRDILRRISPRVFIRRNALNVRVISEMPR